MLTEALKAVAEFHVKGNQPVRWGPNPDPFTGTLPTAKEVQLRLDLIKEEYKELKGHLETFITNLALEEAGGEPEQGDELIGIADGLTDLIYVCLGTYLSLGLDGSALFEEVQRSNLTKFPLTQREDGKVLKGPNYEKPDLRGVIGRQMFGILTRGESVSPYLPEYAVNGWPEGFTVEGIQNFVEHLYTEDNATPEDVAEFLNELGVKASVAPEPAASASDIEGYDDFITHLSKEPAIQSLAGQLADLFGGVPADAQPDDTEAESIQDFLKAAGFAPELGVSG